MNNIITKSLLLGGGLAILSTTACHPSYCEKKAECICTSTSEVCKEDVIIQSCEEDIHNYSNLKLCRNAYNEFLDCWSIYTVCDGSDDSKGSNFLLSELIALGMCRNELASFELKCALETVEQSIKFIDAGSIKEQIGDHNEND